MSCLLMSKLIVRVKEAIECEVDLYDLFCWSDSELGLQRILQQRKKNGMFGYKIELKSSGIIHLHFTSHMFHLISMHQIFPHIPHVSSQSHLCTLVHHFCCIYCLIGQINTICSSRLSEEYFTKQHIIFYHFILFLKNILQ